MSKKEALMQISQKLEEAYRLIRECVKISDETGVVFDLPWGGEGTMQSGLGGSYVPESASEYEKAFFSDRWNNVGWMPSAGSC